MQANAAQTRSGRPGQFRLDLFFKFKRPGHGGTLLHAYVVPSPDPGVSQNFKGEFFTSNSAPASYNDISGTRLHAMGA
jgi:hypothetical protein